jgi:hypothetical protein
LQRPGGRAPSFEKLGPLEALERLELDDGTAVTIRHFGCAHYGLEFTFSLPNSAAPQAGPDYWLERAATLLASLPVTPEDEQRITRTARLLEASADDTYTYGEPLQLSEIASVSVTVEVSPAGTRLVVLYAVIL